MMNQEKIKNLLDETFDWKYKKVKVITRNRNSSEYKLTIHFGNSLNEDNGNIEYRRSYEVFCSLTTGFYRDEIEAYLFLDRVHFSAVSEEVINLEQYREELTQKVINLLYQAIENKQIKIVDEVKFENIE